MNLWVCNQSATDKLVLNVKQQPYSPQATHNTLEYIIMTCTLHILVSLNISDIKHSKSQETTIKMLVDALSFHGSTV